MPEEQGEEFIPVSLAAEELFEVGPFVVTNSMIGALLASLILIASAWWVSRNAAIVPSRLQSIIELP